MPAIQAAGEGWDTYAVTDASGGVSLEAHEMAVRRMVQAGVTPITWLAVAAEWQRDWAREKTAQGLSGVILEHGGGSGIALAWELQLLAGRAAAASDARTKAESACRAPLHRSLPARPLTTLARQSTPRLISRTSRPA